MRATTLKIEDPLLNELVHLKPTKKSTTSFVREILENEVRRQKMILAAEKYAEFLKQNSREKEWLGQWESADLENPPRPFKKKKSGQ